MKISEFFEKANSKDIVINTDIDGFLCGMILQKYYGCRIVGFSNSKESIWLIPEMDSIYKPVYIDIFVNNPGVFCIDQHIVAYDDAYLKTILSWGTKMNPNLDILKKTYIGDYYHKFPFGTVHYLIALMKQDGIDVVFNDLTTTYAVQGCDWREYNICPGQIILRADDALYSSLGPYKANAANWWKQLKSFHSKTIDLLYKYLSETCKEEKNTIYKREIGDFFVNGLGCDGRDGAFNRITQLNDTTLQSRVLNYNKVIGEIVGMEMDLPREVKEYRGTAQLSAWSKEKQNSAVTYAFVCSPSKPLSSFSYTTNIR